MFAIIFGIICISFTIFALLPSSTGLGWGNEVILFLKGAAPVAASLVGIITILLGIADIRDRNEAKREELEAIKAEQETKAQK